MRPSSRGTLSLALTARCDIACRSCAVPSCERETISEQLGKGLIDFFHGTGLLERVHFTGGEPFLERELLNSLAAHAKELGIPSAVVTNAAWCRTPRKARAVLAELHENGIESVAVSVDAYHSAFVPLQNVVELLHAAQELGMATISLATLGDGTEQETEGLLNALLCQVETPIRRRWLMPVGRARGTAILHHSSPFDAVCSECPLQNLLTVYPSGIAFPCCSAGCHQALAVGNINCTSLRSIWLRRRDSPVLSLIQKDGPHALLYACPDSTRRLFTSAKYSSVCHLCYALLDNSVVRDSLAQLKDDTYDVADRVLLEAAILET